MAEIRALIVDDEPLARRGIRQLLADHPDVVVVGECREGRDAVRALASLKPDLLFLDIQMPGLDGLGVVRLYGAERMPLTVFVTAFDAFAVKAFESQALDYLVKPLSAARFGTTMARVRERLKVRDAVAMAKRLAALLEGDGSVESPVEPSRSRGAAIQRIRVRTEQGDRMVDVGTVDWIEVAGDGACLHSAGERHQVQDSLSALEAELDPSQFTRIHRNTLVRLDAVRELRSGPVRRDANAVLRDGTVLPVSRRRVGALRAALGMR